MSLRKALTAIIVPRKRSTSRAHRQKEFALVAICISGKMRRESDATEDEVGQEEAPDGSCSQKITDSAFSIFSCRALMCVVLYLFPKKVDVKPELGMCTEELALEQVLRNR